MSSPHQIVTDVKGTYSVVHFTCPDSSSRPLRPHSLLAMRSLELDSSRFFPFHFTETLSTKTKMPSYSQPHEKPAQKTAATPKTNTKTELNIGPSP